MALDESLTVEGLSVLSEVREVDGYVQVENTNHEDLTNLRLALDKKPFILVESATTGSLYNA